MQQPYEVATQQLEVPASSIHPNFAHQVRAAEHVGQWPLPLLTEHHHIHRVRCQLPPCQASWVHCLNSPHVPHVMMIIIIPCKPYLSASATAPHPRPPCVRQGSWRAPRGLSPLQALTWCATAPARAGGIIITIIKMPASMAWSSGNASGCRYCAGQSCFCKFPPEAS
jgi:hypothetical protein